MSESKTSSERYSFQGTDDEADNEASSADEGDDAEVRLAKQMAIAIASNPGLTADQIRELAAANAAKSSPPKKKKPMLKQAGKAVKKAVKQGGHEVKAIFKTSKSSKKSPDKSSFSFSSGESVSGNFSEPETTGSERFTLRPDSPSHGLSPGKSHGKSPRGSRKLADSSRAPQIPKVSAKSPKLGDYFDSVKTKTPASSARSAQHDIYDDSQSHFTSTGAHSQIRMTGIVWKRRSGLGKYSASQAWERRRIVLKGNKLFYFRTNIDSKDDDSVDSGDEQVGSLQAWVAKTAAEFNGPFATQVQGAMVGTKGSARGSLDLVKENASVCATYGHSGSPTPFALSIKILSQTKWKFCFDTHGELMEWLAATTDVIVQGSVDDYNSQILQAHDPKNADYQTGQLSEPPLIAQSGATMESGHRLWVTGHYQVFSDKYPRVLDDISEGELEDIDEDDDLSVNEEAVKKKRELAQQQQKSNMDFFELDPSTCKEVWSFPAEYILQFAFLWNAAIIVARASSTSIEKFWYLLTACNIIFFGCLTKQKVGGRVRPKLNRMTSQLVGRRFSLTGGRQEKKLSMGMSMSAEDEKPPPEPTEADFVPYAGTTTMRIANPQDLPVKDGHVFAGWCRADPRQMQIRSHGYKKTKVKVPSPGDMYECVHSDIFEARTRYPDMAGRVNLPASRFKEEGPKTWNAPDIFVVSIAIPTDPPKLYGSSENGGGYTVTMYFMMRPETREILKRVTADGYNPSTEKMVDDVQKNKINAVRLFDEWCRRAPTDDAFMARFKVVPNAQNLREIGLPTWISKYNGKPFLIKRPGETGFLYRHPDKSCIEFDISLHPFPYLAKQGICFMKESYFKKVLVTFGFLIEGRADDELPECLIGLMQLCYPDPTHAIQGEDLFAGKTPKSFEGGTK